MKTLELSPPPLELKFMLRIDFIIYEKFHVLLFDTSQTCVCLSISTLACVCYVIAVYYRAHASRSPKASQNGFERLKCSKTLIFSRPFGE